MKSRLSTLLIAVLAVAAFGGLSTAANAKQGADDPAGHVRQSHGADDPAGDAHHTAADDSKARTTTRAHRRGRHGRHAHHRAAHARHGHGADDAPNHG